MYLHESKIENIFDVNRRGKIIKVKRTKTLLHFKCNNCDEEFTREKDGKLQVKTDTHFCKNCPKFSLSQKLTVKEKLKKAKEKGERPKEGYKEIYVGPDYPYNRGLWVREHIVVMENKIKKRIPKGMVVHHIDGDKRNNNIDNLFLCSVQQHNNCHAQIELLVFDLYKKGKVKFNTDTLTYYYVE
jgi:ribosomal protein L44E